MRMNATPPNALWWVYLLACADERYYTGMSMQVSVRYQQHLAGQAAVFTRAHPPIALVGALPVGSRRQAMQLERKVKRWHPIRKVAVFESHHPINRQRTPPLKQEEENAMNRIEEALTALADLRAQAEHLELIIWSDLQSTAPELVDLIRQTGMTESHAAAWISRPNNQLSSQSPAQCIVTGHGDLVTAMVVRTLHGIF